MAESTIGRYKTELINQQGPWKTMEQVEFATLQWVDWYNHQRLHGSCEETHASRVRADESETDHSMKTASKVPGAVQWGAEFRRPDI